MHCCLIAQTRRRNIERIGDQLRPSLRSSDTLEIRSREHPFVVEFAIDGVGTRPLALPVVFDHSLHEGETRCYPFRAGCCSKNPSVGELEQRIASFERLEE